MATRGSTEQIIAKLHELGHGITTEQEGEIELWQKGRALAHLANFYGYEVLLEMIQQYPVRAIDQLLAVRPGETDRVIAAHAVAYALNDFYNKLLQDIESAIQAARTTPEVVKDGLRAATGVPPESL